MDVCEYAYIDKLIEYGYLKKTNDTLEPRTVIFDRNATAKEPSGRIVELRDEIVELFERSFDHYNNVFMGRSFIFEQAVNDGWLKYDNNSVITIGSYIFI